MLADVAGNAREEMEVATQLKVTSSHPSHSSLIPCKLHHAQQDSNGKRLRCSQIWGCPLHPCDSFPCSRRQHKCDTSLKRCCADRGCEHGQLSGGRLMAFLGSLCRLLGQQAQWACPQNNKLHVYDCVEEHVFKGEWSDGIA